MGYGVADTNQDGTITPEELAAYRTSIGLNPDGSRPAGQGGNGLKTPWGTVHPGSLAADSQSKIAQRDALLGQGKAAGDFAGVGEAGYGQMTAEAAAMRDALRRRASGQDSLSAEQLRQGLGSQLSMQRSMAASASPQNGPMAARTAALAMGRASSGMAGNQALAGIQERSAAEQGLSNMLLQQRGQDLNAALGSRQNAISGYGGVTPEKSWMEKYANPIAGAFGAGSAMSDKRLKEDVEDGDSAANDAVKGLRAYTFKYKDQKYGKGKQVGVMAQDLEGAGLKHAVFETPAGKAVDGAKLSTANTAMIAALGRRLSAIEGKGK